MPRIPPLGFVACALLGGIELLVVAAGVLVSGSAAAVTMHALDLTVATGVSANGTIVVGVDTSSGTQQRSVRLNWRTGEREFIGPTHTDPTYYDYPQDVSDDGSVVVGAIARVRGELTENVGSFIAQPGALLTVSGEIAAVSGDGRHAVGTCAEGWACSWVDGQAQRLANPPGVLGWVAMDVSTDGSVVVGYAGGHGAVRWSNGVAELLPTPPAIGRQVARFVSGDGSRIVLQYDFPQSPTAKDAIYLFENGSITEVGEDFNPSGISSDGSTVIGVRGPVSPRKNNVYVWDEASGRTTIEAIFRLAGEEAQLANWFALSPFGISGDGKLIVGRGERPNSVQGWLVSIPEASTALLLALGLAGIAGMRRRH